jgi:outer membrane protein assembly factor BamB
MRLLLLTLLLLSVFLCATAQEFRESAPIEPGAEILDFRVESTSMNACTLVFTFLSGGGCKVYNSQGGLLLQLRDMKGWVSWAGKSLHDNKFYFFNDGLQMVEFQGTESKITRLSSQNLLRTDYDSFLADSLQSLKILVASHPLGVDVYQFPSLKIMAQLSRSEYLRYSPCLVWQGLLVAAMKQNQLVGYDIARKQIAWAFDAGETHPKLLGISVGTFPRRFNCWKVNSQDQILYAVTFDGSLYRIEPRTGKVILQKLQFQGGGNNAGLLTSLYFVDVVGDDKPHIIAPSVDGNIYCIDPEDLSVRWSFDTGNECQLPLAFYDITGDGKPEIFCANDYDLRLSVIEGTKGKCLTSMSLKGGGGYKQIRIAVADLDGDGAPELLAQSSTWKKIRVFHLSTAIPSKR